METAYTASLISWKKTECTRCSFRYTCPKIEENIVLCMGEEVEEDAEGGGFYHLAKQAIRRLARSNKKRKYTQTSSTYIKDEAIGTFKKVLCLPAPTNSLRAAVLHSSHEQEYNNVQA